MQTVDTVSKSYKVRWMIGIEGKKEVGNTILLEYQSYLLKLLRVTTTRNNHSYFVCLLVKYSAGKKKDLFVGSLHFLSIFFLFFFILLCFFKAFYLLTNIVCDCLLQIQLIFPAIHSQLLPCQHWHHLGLMRRLHATWHPYIKSVSSILSDQAQNSCFSFSDQSVLNEDGNKPITMWMAICCHSFQWKWNKNQCFIVIVHERREDSVGVWIFAQYFQFKMQPKTI